MRAIKYLNTTPSTCALYNKGVSEVVYTQDTLTKKIEKKISTIKQEKSHIRIRPRNGRSD